MDLSSKRPGEKIKLTEINPYLTCYLCKGYLIDATTISECLHSFCRSCIIKFLQENSYCPVCEMIINKVKPNLKLDKTLQDIVYKLVPELFLREMTRRKLFYQQYPQIAAQVTPEERGEDTERTIFNPQDCISLSLEYVSDDSAPGAIRFPEIKNGSTDIPLSPEENQALMKRYLQCPGMCRVEVLKKFVRNKYNVDTNLFYIDILYKKVPLPDHYTLIDIAYIYSWKRNEPMKFFFRITDLNKVGEKFDIFNAENPLEFVVKPPVKSRAHPDKPRSNRRRDTAGKARRNGRANKKTSQENPILCDEIRQENSRTKQRIDVSATCKVSDSVKSGHVGVVSDISTEYQDEVHHKANNASLEKLEDDHVIERSSECTFEQKDNIKTTTRLGDSVESNVEIETSFESRNIDQENKENTLDECANDKTDNYESRVNEAAINDSNALVKPDNKQKVKSDTQNEGSAIRNAVYTNITLKRTNNVEIITKIQKVSTKEGQPIGLNILKQTVKKSSSNKIGNNTWCSSKLTKAPTSNKTDKKTESLKKTSITKNNISNDNLLESKVPQDTEEEKRIFLQSFDLKAKTPVTSAVISSKEKIVKEPVKETIIQKRKNSSPVKNDKYKKPKIDKKPTKRIIIQCKPKATTPSSKNSDQISTALQSTGLQTLIENCKIPSSLSITIKESSDNNKQAILPPVKNYIEILKLPDDTVSTSTISSTAETNGAATKLEFPLKLCDNDSEQKVDQDLAEIARSLTEKIPMSTTISQIVGPKQQFPIPTKPSVSTKPNILPSPVPELTSKLLNIPKESGKLAPRSPQTFQKIFEQSIKKPENGKPEDKDVQKNALDLSNENPLTTTNTKRNILEIASQLYKKTKLELERNHTELSPQTNPTGKVPIPRLPQKTRKPLQKNLKFEIADAMKFPQTVTNLHSNALGMNYTVSVGPNSSAVTKVNGTVTNIAKDNSLEHSNKPVSDVPNFSDTKVTVRSPNKFTVPKELPSSSPRPNLFPRNLSPNLGYNSPRNSPKHSPKSSPVIKHMYAPTPNLLTDPLRVNTFSYKVPSPKVSDISKQTSPIKSPSPSRTKMSPSPKLSPSLPKPSSSPSLSPKTLISTQPSRSNSVVAQETPSGSSASTTSKPSPTTSTQMSPSQILEKYNIQNLAQLTASLNFNASNFGMNPGNQLAALQHAMLLKHFEMQNRQNWLNMNQGPLLQYEKYLQSLKTNQNHLLGNIKEN